MTPTDYPHQCRLCSSRLALRPDSLAASASLFRFQTGDPRDALPTGNVPIPGVTGIQGIRPLNAV